MKIPEIARIQGTIHMGDTFYLVAVLYDDEENTDLTPLTGMTPRATLMSPKGVHVANFSCAYLEQVGEPGDDDYLPKRVAVTMPAANTTADLANGREYRGELDLVDGDGAPFRKLIMELIAELGQAPAEA